MDANVLYQNACVSGVACYSGQGLIILYTQALAEILGMNAAQLWESACESGVACFSGEALQTLTAEAGRLIVISGGGGGGCCNDSGANDPSVAPLNPAITWMYTNTTTGTVWTWPGGGAAWKQVV